MFVWKINYFFWLPLFVTFFTLISSTSSLSVSGFSTTLDFFGAALFLTVFGLAAFGFGTSTTS